ncbi:MAG: FAD-binding and (Fe-S)-binding domain-containing protein [Candidatus Sericytochromatia bacterium]
MILDQENKISNDLKKLVDSKVLDDFPAITSYSIDASIYKLKPKAIVLLESEDDLIKIIQYASQNKIPITARSGGTNLTGNAVGEGIILDFSPMNKVVNVDIESKSSIVQPGIALHEYQRELNKYGLMYGPDPSSGDMCKLGGMFANNSAGPHTLKYGAVKTNVNELTVFLPNAKKIIAKKYKVDSQEYFNLINEHSWVKDFTNLVKNNLELILKKRLGVSKNSSGYNIIDIAQEIKDKNILDLTKLFIGSEGTLGLIIESKLPLYEKPIKTATMLIYFKDINEIGEGVKDILKTNPSALEIMDNNTLNLIGRNKFDIPYDAKSMLLVEFDKEPIDEKIQSVKELTKKYNLCEKLEVAHEKEAQEELWKVRKAVYPTLYKYGNNKKPINFCDDVVVSAENLPALMKYLDDIFKEYNVPVAIYGHIGDGNAHINPLLNINDPEEFQKMVDLSENIHREVINRFDGSICGEHGDGRVRAEFLKEMYGDEMYSLFIQIKKMIDPDNIFNPDIKLTDKKFTEYIDLERIAKQCATCGKCNSVCPVYDITQDESNSARGWFHILTDKDYSYENSKRVVSACINCKNCANVCPAGVDVAEIVLEKRFEHPNKLTELIFRFQQNEKLFSLATTFMGATQALWDNKFIRPIIELLAKPIMKAIAPTAGIPKEMKMPKISSTTLREKYGHLTEEAGKKGDIAYFHGCAANYLENGIGESVINVLSKNGIEPVLPKQRCSGTPILTYGNKDIAMENAKFNLDSLAKYKTVITSCASCNLMLKEYTKYLGEEPEYSEKAKDLHDKVRDISEYIFKDLDIVPPKGFKEQKRVTYHSSCHLRVAGITKEPKQVIKNIPNVDFVEMRDSERCAGGAGSFIIKNYEQSKEIFWRKERGIEESKAEIVTTSCPACEIQLKDGLKNKNIEVKHVIKLLSDAYDE